MLFGKTKNICDNPGTSSFDTRFAAINFLPALLAVILPKCPLCLIGLLSLFGLSSVIAAEWLLPASLFFLAVALCSLGYRACRQSAFAPLALGTFAASLILSGKFFYENSFVLYIGFFLLVTAIVWNSWCVIRLKNQNNCNCP